jgi:two-component system response regulator
MTTSDGVDVLLVEDNHDHARFILRALQEDGGMETHWATDGQAALEFLRARYADNREAGTARPLVILLDIHLPKISGLDVLRQIRGEEAFPAIPVVMLTTSDQREGISAAYRAGANSYVTKPVKFGDFVQKMESLKRYWTFTSEIPAA